MSYIAYDQRVPEGTCSQVLRSTSVDSYRFRAYKFSVLKLIAIVIVLGYYTIPLIFASACLDHFGASLFNLLNVIVWLR